MGFKSTMATVFGGIVAVVLLIAVLGSFYTIDQTERGVQLTNGAVTGVANPGMNFKIPFFQSVSKVSIQSSTMRYPGLQAYSKDQQPAKLAVSVTFHVPEGEVLNLYKRYQNVDNLLARSMNRAVPSKVENVFGQYTAVLAVQKRPQFEADVAKAIRDELSGQPIVVESVQIENIDFDDSYEASIQQRMKAEVEVQTANQNLAKEQVAAQIAVTQAQAQADSNLAVAAAEAKAITLRGEAEATAIKAKAEALAKNQDLVQLTKAERWDGKLPTHVLPNSTVPFIDTK